MNELLSIADFGKQPTIDRNYFPGDLGVNASEVTSTFRLHMLQWVNEVHSGSQIDRFISFDSGSIDDANINSVTHAYRPIWSATPDTHPALKGDLESYALQRRELTITGAQSGFLNNPTSDSISNYANKMKFGGHSDWRVANIKEISILSPYGYWSTTRSPQGNFYIASGGRITLTSNDYASYLPLLVRGGTRYSGPLSYPETVTLTAIDSAGGKTVCTPSGTVSYGTSAQCRPVPDEGFQANIGAGGARYFPSSLCLPLSRLGPTVSAGGFQPVSSDGIFTIPALTENCSVQYSVFTQIRSLVLAVVEPTDGGSLSCSGTGDNGWVKIGDTGACNAVAKPGFKLRSVSGCNGTPGNPGAYSTAEITKSCTVTAAFIKTQTIAFPPPAVPSFSAGSTFNLNATSTSGASVTFSAEPSSVCTVADSMVTMVSPGVCTLTALQPGTADLEAAEPVTYEVMLSTQPGSKPNAVPALAEWALVLLGLLATGLTWRKMRAWA